jgi:hypothetical protein
MYYTTSRRGQENRGGKHKEWMAKRVDQRAGCRSTDRRGDKPRHQIGSNGYHVPPLLIVHDSQSVTYKYDSGWGRDVLREEGQTFLRPQELISPDLASSCLVDVQSARTLLL